MRKALLLLMLLAGCRSAPMAPHTAVTPSAAWPFAMLPVRELPPEPILFQLGNTSATYGSGSLRFYIKFNHPRAEMVQVVIDADRMPSSGFAVGNLGVDLIAGNVFDGHMRLARWGQGGPVVLGEIPQLRFGRTLEFSIPLSVLDGWDGSGDYFVEFYDAQGDWLGLIAGVALPERVASGDRWPLREDD